MLPCHMKICIYMSIYTSVYPVSLHAFICVYTYVYLISETKTEAAFSEQVVFLYGLKQEKSPVRTVCS